MSEAPQEAPKANKYCSQDILFEKSEDEKKKEVFAYLFTCVTFKDGIRRQNK